VRILAARLTDLRLPLRAPLATAHGAVTLREGALLELEGEGKLRGFGEALPLPGFGLETAAEARAALEDLARHLLGRDLREPDPLLDEVTRRAPTAPAARAAADTALHDLAARAAGAPLAAWLAPRSGGDARERVALCALLSATSPGAAAEEARRRVARGFGALKLKVGSGEIEADRARVAAVREAVGSAVRIRLDANGGWKEADAAAHLRQLAPFAIEFLEQPLPAEELEALARLRAAAPFPIAADEAVRGEREAEALLAARAADLLVVKPAAVGGLRAARRIAARADASGVGVVVTSFLDSVVGRSAALHLAAARPGEPRAAGLATGELLACDLAAGPQPSGGFLALPPGPGLGVVPAPRALRRCAAGATRELRG
jgi:o-succinylbenzoate synthase